MPGIRCAALNGIGARSGRRIYGLEKAVQLVRRNAKTSTGGSSDPPRFNFARLNAPINRSWMNAQGRSEFGNREKRRRLRRLHMQTFAFAASV
jgi:hypothetical protein